MIAVSLYPPLRIAALRKLWQGPCPFLTRETRRNFVLAWHCVSTRPTTVKVDDVSASTVLSLATEGGAHLTNVVQTEEGLSLLSKDTQLAQCLFCKYATLALILYSIPQIGSSSYLRVRWRCPSWRPRPPARASPSRPRAEDGRHHHRRCYSSWRTSRSLTTFRNHGCAVDTSTFAFGRWLA